MRLMALALFDLARGIASSLVSNNEKLPNVTKNFATNVGFACFFIAHQPAGSGEYGDSKTRTNARKSASIRIHASPGTADPTKTLDGGFVTAFVAQLDGQDILGLLFLHREVLDVAFFLKDLRDAELDF